MQPVNGGRQLLDEIEGALCPSPRLWWLGHSGFVLKYLNAIIYIDTLLSSAHPERLVAPPFAGEEVTHAGLILCTHAHAGHLDRGTIPAILRGSRRAKLVIPMSVAGHAHALGVDYHRMVTTNADLRVEFLDDRIYAVPSAHNQLDWTPQGGYPYLGKVFLRAAPPGTGIIAGGPMRAVFETLGMQDVVAKSLGSSNPYNVVRATFDALKHQDSPRSVAARRNIKVSTLQSRRREGDAEAAAD